MLMEQGKIMGEREIWIFPVGMEKKMGEGTVETVSLILDTAQSW